MTLALALLAPYYRHRRHSHSSIYLEGGRVSRLLAGPHSPSDGIYGIQGGAFWRLQCRLRSVQGHAISKAKYDHNRFSSSVRYNPLHIEPVRAVALHARTLRIQ